jgi:glycosyltransferase involved in cell wall biosynthesis
MRIAIDARMYGNEECTGIGTYIHRLTNELFKIDQKNQYLIFLKEPAFSKFVCPNDNVEKALLTPRWYTYGEQLKMPFELMKHKIDLIHYPQFNSPIFYCKKSICTIHDTTPLHFPGHKMSSFYRKLAHKAVFQATVRKAKKIIAVSNSTKRDIVKYFHLNPDKIEVTHEGVDERFKIVEKSDIINKVREKFGLEKPYIFYVGVWRNHKNIEGLIKAFNLLKKKHNLPHQLVLGGREDLHYTAVRAEIKRSPYQKDIITTGYIEDQELPVLYNQADCFVLPSFIEGFGLIAIEAQSCGCPVASTNTSSMPEVLNDSALFFDPNDHSQMADQIYQVINNPELKTKLINKGNFNVQRFSWAKCAKQTLEIYNNIK